MFDSHNETVGPRAEIDRGVGARWWSLDIHAHSPASFDYGGLDGVSNDAAKPTFKEWLKAYIDAGVDGIVIADHNTHEGIQPAREALAELYEEDPDLPPLVIFPGAEITITGGFHAVAIFDPGCEPEVVLETLTLCKFDGTRGRSNHTANVTVRDAAKTVHERGGLFVPAHVDRPAGILETDEAGNLRMDDRDLSAIAESPYIAAVEVIDDDNVDKAVANNWVPLLGSDAHHLDVAPGVDPTTAKTPGSHLTLVKAELLNLQGLQLALTDHTESIQRVRRDYEDPNEVRHGHINSLRVEHRGANQAYRFGPWMNCLIGGRGVGKSTVIELLRLALGRSHELVGGVAHDLRRFDPGAEAVERWWDTSTRIIVEYTKDRRLFRVTWSGEEPDRPTVELRNGTKWEPQSGRVFDRAPIRVFSQKQIYELASSPQSFLTILDDMPAIGRGEWDEEHEALRLQFKTERNNLRQLLAESEKADRLRGQLEDVRGRLRHLEELRASEQYKELNSLETQIRDTTSAETQAREVQQTARTAAETLRSVAPESLDPTGYAGRAVTLRRAAELLDEAAAVLAAGEVEWEHGGVARRWTSRVEELNKWLNEQGGASSGSGDSTSEDRQRESAFELELEALNDTDRRCAEQHAVIDEVLAKIVAKRRELFERRKQYVEGLSSAEDALTKVDVFHQGETGSLGSSLRELLGCPESFDSAFSKDGIPSLLTMYEPKAPSFAGRVAEFKIRLVELAEKGADSSLAAEVRIDGRFYGRIANLDTFDLVTEIQLWFPDDLVSVRYRPKPRENFVTVDRGSPGQKTAALLTVILQMGSDPLLLDQPEDDLENKLIRHLAVATLKQIKRNRQLVVSTHNANVVVTSGAENILVLQHGDLPAIEAGGTLQQRAVRDDVCEILEGGEEAIKTRYNRLVGPSRV